MQERFWVVIGSTPAEDWVTRTFSRFRNAMSYVRRTLTIFDHWTLTVVEVQLENPKTQVVQWFPARDGGYRIGREASGYYAVFGPRGGRKGVYAYLVDAVARCKSYRRASK